jgi:2-methylisocitrate lyase-like PEP mutase family enzyme
MLLQLWDSLPLPAGRHLVVCRGANAWDVASAWIFEDAGFAALGSASAGIANSLGYPDGQRIPLSEMVAEVNRIAEAVRIPVTADMEGR